MGRLMGIEPTNAGATIRCVNHFATTAMIFWCRLEDLNPQPTDYKSVALPIELSRLVISKWWLGTESNRRHEDFQSSALPTELPSLYVKNGGPDRGRTGDLLRDRQAC